MNKLENRDVVQFESFEDRRYYIELMADKGIPMHECVLKDLDDRDDFNTYPTLRWYNKGYASLTRRTKDNERDVYYLNWLTPDEFMNKAGIKSNEPWKGRRTIHTFKFA